VKLFLTVIVAVMGLLTALGANVEADDFNRTNLPIPDQPFLGKTGLRPADSVKDFPKEVTAPEGAPNILLILTDDVGFGASSTFGGPIPTPTMDRVAEAGLRYNNFHTTALCSPTRAALLTGRNHHKCGHRWNYGNRCWLSRVQYAGPQNEARIWRYFEAQRL